MMSKAKILKCGELIENALNGQTYISSVKKEKSKGDSVTFICNMNSEEGNARKVFVSADFLNQDRVDISYYGIIDNGVKLIDGIGLALAGELTRKYRFIKNYIKEGVSVDGKKEYFFIGEYDCLLRLDNLESFKKALADISMMYCSVLSDCIDIERNIFAEYEKENIVIKPNPFEQF